MSRMFTSSSIVLDLSSPSTILTELTTWLQGITLVTERMMSVFTPEQQQQYKSKSEFERSMPQRC